METNFEQLVVKLNISSLSADVLQQITLLLKQQTDESLSTFVSQVYQSLVTLENNIWQILSFHSHESFNQSSSSEFFQAFALFNKNLIFNQDIKDDIKVSLLIPETIDQIHGILQQITQTIDDNDPLITFASLWFDNLSFFIHEYPQLGYLPIIIHINQYFQHHFLMNEQFKVYLNQLQQSPLLPSIFTAKQLFYMKTCPLSLNAYICTNPKNFEYNHDQVVKQIGDDFLQMVQVQSYTMESWSKELLACITHLIGFMRMFLWKEEEGTKLKILFSTEKILCQYIEAVIRMIDYKPFYKSVTTQWFNCETILIDSILFSLINLTQSQNINWFLRSLTQLPDILLKIVELSAYFRIYLCAYGILSEILTDEQLKELKITNGIRSFFFHMLEQAWQDRSKKNNQVQINQFLRGFLNLSKNDHIQQVFGKSNRVLLFIEMCDEYPIAFDIIWALSFNPDIQQQLRSNSSFMSKLAHLEKEHDNEQIKKAVHGILWNLKVNHEDRTTSEIDNEKEKTFDIMISYSHKEKVLCQQIYDELTKSGYRVWIDFDQMHGNVMDAMALAIEQAHTVIICMSEEYQKSNYCRAEAHYAFQRQRKIVPILSQKHYKPDGWLLFLLGELLYVDFGKHEFVPAMKMLFKEITAEETVEADVSPVHPKEDNHTTVPITSEPIPKEDTRTTVPVTSVSMPKEDTRTTVPVTSESMPKVSPSPTFSQNILEWTDTQVQQWLVEHNLAQMSHLLTNCDGRSLVYLNKYMKSCESQQILNLLQEDSLRRTKQSISLIELSCFHSLMDQQKRLFQSTETNTNIEKKDT